MVVTCILGWLPLVACFGLEECRFFSRKRTISLFRSLPLPKHYLHYIFISLRMFWTGFVHPAFQLLALRKARAIAERESKASSSPYRPIPRLLSNGQLLFNVLQCFFQLQHGSRPSSQVWASTIIDFLGSPYFELLQLVPMPFPESFLSVISGTMGNRRGWKFSRLLHMARMVTSGHNMGYAHKAAAHMLAVGNPSWSGFYLQAFHHHRGRGMSERNSCW